LIKKLFLFYFVSFLFSSLFSQENNLVSRYRPGVMWFFTGIKPAKLEKVRKYDRLILDVVYNDWSGKKLKPFKNNIGSIGFNTSLMFDIPLVPKNKVAFGIGLSYCFYKINHNDFFVRNSDSSITSIVKDVSQYGIEKSIFKIHSIALPLELRFRGENYKHFKVNVGAKISYQFLATSVLSSKKENITSKQKMLGFYDLNPLNVSAHIRFGIRNWALFGAYNFLPYFKSKQSIQMNGFQFGLSISMF
jgi:hypothetical protein